MGNFSANYNSAEIYSNFKASELKDLTIDNADLLFKNQITLKTLKSTDSRSDFDKICKLYIESKQICVVCKQKLIISINKKLEEVHLTF